MQEDEFTHLLDETMGLASDVSAQLASVRHSYDVPWSKPSLVQWLRDLNRALQYSPDLYERLAESEKRTSPR